MEERKFEVLNGNYRLATNMRLENALLFISALFNEYHSDNTLVISIKEMDKNIKE